jgi:hypothetical protein
MGVRLTDFSFNHRSIVRSVFIETGTYQGETLDIARQAGFEQLYSIEFVLEYYIAACKKFITYENVSCRYGSSPEELPKIIDPKMPTTFWLDAHYQSNSIYEQDPKYGQCPLIAELKAIFAQPWEVSPIILIDDAHMFLKSVPTNFDQSQWPTLSDIQSILPKEYILYSQIKKNSIRIGPIVEDMMDNVIYCATE